MVGHGTDLNQPVYQPSPNKLAGNTVIDIEKPRYSDSAWVN